MQPGPPPPSFPPCPPPPGPGLEDPGQDGPGKGGQDTLLLCCCSFLPFNICKVTHFTCLHVLHPCSPYMKSWAKTPILLHK